MNWRARATILLREPLVHFLLAGALVFGLLAGRMPDAGERRIVVNEALVARLADRWTSTYRRPPTQDEIDGLIRDYVRDQIYYREALRLGLDRDDEVVVRRMRAKMQSLASAEAESRAPGDAELQALLDKDPARYAPEPRYSLRQIYLGADTLELRKSAAATLARGDAVEALARPAPLPSEFTYVPASEFAGQFGDEFAAALPALPIGQWRGPVASGLGLHLVKLTARVAPVAPRLADVRQRIENDWRAAALRAAEEQGYRRMLEGYDVSIEKPR